MKDTAKPKDIDEYLKGFAPEIQSILEGIRATIREVAPEAKEKISYRMPAFTLDGVFIYFAAFKEHIGVYPPVKGDEELGRDLAAYRGPKGNLKFPLNEPIPEPLIKRVVEHALKEHQERIAAERAKK